MDNANGPTIPPLALLMPSFKTLFYHQGYALIQFDSYSPGGHVGNVREYLS